MWLSRLLHRATSSDQFPDQSLAATLGGDFADTVDLVDRLVGSGLLLDGPTLRLSPEGRGRLEELLAGERSQVDEAAVLAAYDEFRSVNAEFKTLPVK